MKKIYLNPEIQVVKIATAQKVLTLSANLTDDTITDENGFGARGGDWDED